WLLHAGGTVAASSNRVVASVPTIRLASVLVDDQDKALRFYTQILGFVKKLDVPTGEPGGARWLTVVSSDEPDGAELLLEPTGFAPSKIYKKALFDLGMPLISLASSDVKKEFERLKNQGVKFSAEPTTLGETTIAIFDDTCGNRIQIFQTPQIT